MGSSLTNILVYTTVRFFQPHLPTSVHSSPKRSSGPIQKVTAASRRVVVKHPPGHFQHQHTKNDSRFLSTCEPTMNGRSSLTRPALRKAVSDILAAIQSKLRRGCHDHFSSKPLSQIHRHQGKPRMASCTSTRVQLWATLVPPANDLPIFCQTTLRF